MSLWLITMQTMSEVIWEDPPVVHNQPGRTKWERRLLPLKEYPERWARVASYETYASAKSTLLKLQASETRLRVPPGKWEFTWAKNGDEATHIYARYLGEEAT